MSQQAAQAAGIGVAQGDGPGLSLRNAWQVPALVGALLMLASGVVTAVVSSPRADPAKVMTLAEGLLDREDFPAALDVLNRRVRPYCESGSLAPEMQKRFHILRARSVYLGEQKNGVQLEENARTVSEEYGAATRKGGEGLEARDVYYWADASATLGRVERAMELAAQLPAAEHAGRGRVYRRLVERQLASSHPDGEQLMQMLGEFQKDDQTTAADRSWALARQAEFLIKAGQLESAISKIVQTLPGLLAEAPLDELGELYLLLGRAYIESGALAEAAKRLEEAVKALLPTDIRRARALVLMGRVEEQLNPDPAEGKAEARQRYTAVLEEFAASEARLPALLGLGEVEAGLGNTDPSLKAYTELVGELAAGKRNPDISIEGVTASLLERARARLAGGDAPAALRYGEQAERLYTADTAPADLLLVLGQAHRKAAEQMLAPGGSVGLLRLVELTGVKPEVREEARKHLVSAGGYYRRHSERVAVENNTAFGESLWLAADSMDLAGDSEAAIPLFSDFARYFPGDPRQPEARFRLGQAYQAKGDYGTAAELYRVLIEDGRKTPNTAGPFGDKSYVPLAQCLLMNADASDDGQAEQLLSRVVEGGAGNITSPQYRDGLVELAGLESRRADFARAIEHLEAAVERFPDDARLEELRYALADAYRQDARAIRQTLTQGMPDRQRQLLEQTRLERLRRAQAGFEQVRRALEGRDPRMLSKLDQLRLRNSSFYVGDCAYDLKDFDGAIHHYDAAREKYPGDPASLVAMVQIVNAYVEQGDLQRARTANERAISFYRSLPPQAWQDPTLPMSKDEWGRWLDSMSTLMKTGVTVGAPGGDS